MGTEKVTRGEPINTVLTGPLVWRAADLKEDDWKFCLDEACLNEIELAVAHHKSHRLPIELLDAGRFDMPCCQIVMSKVREALVAGCGFALVDRLPMDRLHSEDAKLSYWLLSSMISRPVAQKLDGTMIYDVQDTGKRPSRDQVFDRIKRISTLPSTMIIPTTTQCLILLVCCV